MTYIQIKELIESIGLPFNYFQWEVGQVPDLPYILFYYPERNDFLADGKNYQHIARLNIELYTSKKDFAREAEVEAVLENAGIVYEKEEQYISDERMYEVLYTMEVLING